jgi:hypothetical protein
MFFSRKTRKTTGFKLQKSQISKIFCIFFTTHEIQNTRKIPEKRSF